MRYLFFVAGIIFLEISWTPGDFVFLPHRMMAFYIFLIFFGGIAVAQSCKVLKNFKDQSIGLRMTSFGILLLAFVSILGQVALKQEADEKIRQTGGKGFWSDAIYRVAYFVEQGGWEETVCLDWDLRRPLFVLTKGEILLTAPLENIATNPTMKRQMLGRLIQEASPRTLFLLYPEQIWRDGVDMKDFRMAAQNIRRELKLEQVFLDREGEPLYFAYTVGIKQL